MSLDIYLTAPKRCPHCNNDLPEIRPYSANITHNLHAMWREAGCEDALYESAGKKAADILPTLDAAIAAMRADPPRFERHNAPNGWGLYKHALPWLVELAEACRKSPEAEIEVSR